MNRKCLAFLCCLVAAALQVHALDAAKFGSDVQARVDREYPSLFAIYTNFHAHPELSFQEVKTSQRFAQELRKAGFVVTTGIGRYGVVGVLENGPGETVLFRTDLDALPVKEETGLPYASREIAKDPSGKDVPVMHACGHDMHMTSAIGTARVLSQMKDRWHGTLIMIGQPAEERGGGARTMLLDGLFTRFPVPDVCLALHDNAELPAGTLAYCPGYDSANVDSVDITVKGVGGHGAYPHKTKDPIVLASQIVLALQTIASRETQPGDPVVVTVGSIHGGTKHNIIPDDVMLQLTVRSYSDAVRTNTLAAIARIAKGEAIAAGMPEDRMPEVIVAGDMTPAGYNDPEITERLAKDFRAWFGASRVITRKPSMGGEDFSEFGRTKEKIPICMFGVGGVDPKAYEASKKGGKPLPSLHSSLWAPVPEPTIKTGIAASCAAILEFMGR
jgi:hippurate hydrolase